MKEIYLVTQNKGKLLAAKSVFDKKNINLLNVKKDYPEIQAETSLEIAKYTANQAAKDLDAPAIREDHSIFIHAINFPGPFSSYMEKNVPPELLLKILKGFGDRTGHFQVASVYVEPDGKTFEFVFEVPFTIKKQIVGKSKNGWNNLIKLNDEKRALTEYPESERLHIWNQGYAAISKYISSSRS